jgi:hypothetical protein
MISKITDHSAESLKRLITQFRNKPRIEGMITAFSDQIQSLEDTLYDLGVTGRSVFTAVGQQLDRIGEIVDQERPLNFSDEIYRIILLAKIGLNVSQGEIEAVIGVYGLITQASLVHLQEYYPAAVGLFSNNQVDDDFVDMVYQFVSSVVGAGISVDAFGWFDDITPFELAGAGGSGLGFADENNLSVGGRLGGNYNVTIPYFAFSGIDIDPDALGFGSDDDAAIGGKFV